MTTTVGTNYTLNVAGNTHEVHEGGYAVTSGKDFVAAATTNMTVSAVAGMVVAAGDALVIKCGDASITLSASGEIKITGSTVTVCGSQEVDVKAPKVKLN